MKDNDVDTGKAPGVQSRSLAHGYSCAEWSEYAFPTKEARPARQGSEDTTLDVCLQLLSKRQEVATLVEDSFGGPGHVLAPC